jgi:acetyl-CoA/propionyl-CoA carboxylase biotin carboxyl carrier protein
MHVEGLPTVLPFHRKIVNEPAFIGNSASNTFGIYTRWIETEWNNDIPAWNGIHEEATPAVERNTVAVEVDGKRIEVSLPQRILPATVGVVSANAASAPKRKAHGTASGAASGKILKAPMQSTVIKIAVAVGDKVTEGDLLVVLEAMKMEQPMAAHMSGVVKSISAEIGVTIAAGTVLLELE